MQEKEYLGPWRIIKTLGVGGQGTVYLVQSPERDKKLNESVATVEDLIARQLGTSDRDKRRENTHKFLTALLDCTRDDFPQELGAGKRYDIRGGPLAEETLSRLKTEFDVLSSTNSPHVLRLLHSDLGSKLMVTEFHPGGQLDQHPDRFKGKAYDSLVAIRGVIAAVRDLHGRGVIHRDIKPANIFVARDGRLVLGDFGIVFVDVGDRTRLTGTYDRVGTRDWMPAWAHTGMRIDDVKPSFDVFCLGKVLWSMISGRSMLPLWYWDRDVNNLEKLFPAQAAPMRLINKRILAAAVVQEEEHCLADAGALMERVEEVVETLENSGQSIGDGMRCVVCGRGTYVTAFKGEELRIFAAPKVLAPGVGAAGLMNEFIKGNNHMAVRPYKCKHCGHVALFQFPDGDSHAAWAK